MDAYKASLYKFPLSFSVKAVSIGQDLVSLRFIEQSCFPLHMQDSEQYLKEFFDERQAYGLLLFKQGELVGCIKGNPINDLNSPQNVWPQDIEAGRGFYIDSISIIEAHRSALLLDFLVHEMMCALRARGYVYAGAHIRVKYGLSQVLQSRYQARLLSRYEDWCDFSEPFDYLLFDLRLFPQEAKLFKKALSLLRRFWHVF